MVPTALHSCPVCICKWSWWHRGEALICCLVWHSHQQEIGEINSRKFVYTPYPGFYLAGAKGSMSQSTCSASASSISCSLHSPLFLPHHTRLNNCKTWHSEYFHKCPISFMVSVDSCGWWWCCFCLGSLPEGWWVCAVSLWWRLYLQLCLPPPLALETPSLTSVSFYLSCYGLITAISYNWSSLM